MLLRWLPPASAVDDGFGFVRVPKGGEARPDGPIGSGGEEVTHFSD